MRPSQRLTLIDRIARELQERYTYTDIDVYFRAFAVDVDHYTGSYSSKWVYAKQVLADLTEEALARIADDLELEGLRAVALQASPPDEWKGTDAFRVFISHVSAEKAKATRLKSCLEAFGIKGFVAHEDIHPTKEWQGEIERGLFCMEALVALHTLGFSKSYWTQQEVGVAIGRDTPIISIRMGEDPTGFISKHQAISRGKKTAEQIASEIDVLLTSNERTTLRLDQAKKAMKIVYDEDDEIPF